MSDVGGNFVSNKFKESCKQLNIEHAVSSSYHPQSNKQIDVGIRFIK